jgi:hypothetical protein
VLLAFLTRDDAERRGMGYSHDPGGRPQRNQLTSQIWTANAQ